MLGWRGSEPEYEHSLYRIAFLYGRTAHTVQWVMNKGGAPWFRPDAVPGRLQRTITMDNVQQFACIPSRSGLVEVLRTLQVYALDKKL